LESSWTGGRASLLCTEKHNSTTAAHCLHSTDFSYGPRNCSAILKKVLLNSKSNDGYRDEDHATTTLPPPLQLGITVTASLCITAAQCRESTKFSNGHCTAGGTAYGLQNIKIFCNTEGTSVFIEGENRVLRRIDGSKGKEVTGDRKKLYFEELHDLCSTPNISVVKSGSVKWVM
jgi:hypothetical protein